MTPQDSRLVCHLQWRRLHSERGHVLPLLHIAGNVGGTRAHTKALPLSQAQGILSPRSPDAMPSRRGCATDSGSGTIGHVGRSPLLCMAGQGGATWASAPTFSNSWARRTTWGKQETHQSVLPATTTLSKMTSCTRRAENLKKLSIHKNKSGTLVALG